MTRWVRGGLQPVRVCRGSQPGAPAADTRGRLPYPSAQTEEKKVRKQLAARYQTVETRKDGVKFTSKALAAAAERLQAVSREYDRCQHTLVEQARDPGAKPHACGRPPHSCCSIRPPALG